MHHSAYRPVKTLPEAHCLADRVEKTGAVLLFSVNLPATSAGLREREGNYAREPEK